MTCSEVQAGLSLYLYGELDFAAEELIEDHLSQCAACHLSLNREKEWHVAVNRQQQDVNPEWLSMCRSSLHHHIAGEPISAVSSLHLMWDWLRGFFDFRTTERSYRLAAVSFLLVLGFGAGRIGNSFHLVLGQRSLGDAAGFLQPSVTHVQEVRPESGNRVHIILQQVQVREVSGSRDDNGVRTLLVGAARNSVDPGVRMDSVEMLAGQGGVEIRDAIVSTIKNDPNAAVRLKAVELLRQFSSDAVTREALEFALAQ